MTTKKLFMQRGALMHAVSVIVPTLNEAENIDVLLKCLFRVRRSYSLHFDVIFADSSSSDGTCERVAAWQDRDDVSLLTCPPGTSLAQAVLAAVATVRGEIAVVMDADLSHPPEILPELIMPVLDGSCDMVIGSRYTAGGSTPDWPVYRKISSRLATLPARLFTRVNDPLSGFFAVERARLQALPRSVAGFKIGLEILAAGGTGLRVKEVPIEFRDRRYGISKMNHDVASIYAMQLLALAKDRMSVKL